MRRCADTGRSPITSSDLIERGPKSVQLRTLKGRDWFVVLLHAWKEKWPISNVKSQTSNSIFWPITNCNVHKQTTPSQCNGTNAKWRISIPKQRWNISIVLTLNVRQIAIEAVIKKAAPSGRAFAHNDDAVERVDESQFFCGTIHFSVWFLNRKTLVHVGRAAGIDGAVNGRRIFNDSARSPKPQTKDYRVFCCLPLSIFFPGSFLPYWARTL